MENIKQQRKELYISKWTSLEDKLVAYNFECEIIGNVRATNHLLLQVKDDYHKSKKRVMLFGQETNDWEGGINENSKVDA